ncbi:YobA family protein [Bacillus shivajii]|uniref:DUF3221 domain-containing protein n=1 Tax=Bacillus shivajii TaxID=1983719 RepID=UPI001CFB6039|nr:DUF3221 domain-containing protein [Bacillus shivajii]UCZ53809.1 YobA family protein [Bacillus shivajii]
MKFIFFVFTMILFTACSANSTQDEPFITGVVVQKNESTVLVVEGIEFHGEIDQEEWYSHDAVSFSVSENTEVVHANNSALAYHEVREGDKVEVWQRGGVKESYPLQTDARKIRVIEDYAIN